MKFASTIKVLLAIISAVILFHLGIILKIIPYGNIWGGRLSSDREMYIAVSVSILVNLLLALILLMKGGYIHRYFPACAQNIILWIFLCWFVINTIGNLISQTFLEKSFAILTLVMSFLLWKILREKNNVTNP